MKHLRLAIRSLGRAPGFTLAAAATLALGIGASTAVFTLVHAVILKPLPFRDPGRLLAVWDTYQPQFARIGVSPAEYDAWKRETGLFDSVAWYRSVPLNLTLSGAGGEPQEVAATVIAPAFLPLLGDGSRIGAARGSRERTSAQPPLVAHTLRLRPEDRRTPGAARRPGIHDQRGDAGSVPLP